MVGVEGGLMAIIHLVLKRPILGVLGVAGLIAVEVNDYPLGDTVMDSIRSVGFSIEDARADSVASLIDQTELVEKRYHIIGNVSESLRDAGYALEDVRENMLAFLDEQAKITEEWYHSFDTRKEAHAAGTTRLVTETPSTAQLLVANHNAIRLPFEKSIMEPLSTERRIVVQLPAGFR